MGAQLAKVVAIPLLPNNAINNTDHYHRKPCNNVSDDHPFRLRVVIAEAPRFPGQVQWPCSAPSSSSRRLSQYPGRRCECATATMRMWSSLTWYRSRRTGNAWSDTDGPCVRPDSTHWDSAVFGLWSRRLLRGTRSPSRVGSPHSNRPPRSTHVGRRDGMRTSLGEPFSDFGKYLLARDCLNLPRIEFLNPTFRLLRPEPVNLLPTRRIQALEQSVHQVNPVFAGKRQDLICQFGCCCCHV